MLTNNADFRNDCYHDPCDTLERLNFTFMSQVVKATLAAMAQMVEIQHADWASASFEVTSAATEPTICGFRLLQSAGLSLQADACFSEDVTLELYDMKGGLQWTENWQVPTGGVISLPVNGLPAGVYALKIRHKEGIFSQKVIIH